MEYNVQTDIGYRALDSECSEVGHEGYETGDDGEFELVRHKRKCRDTNGAQIYMKTFDSVLRTINWL